MISSTKLWVQFVLFVILLVFGLAPGSVAAQAADNANLPCVKADKELNRVYQKVRKVYKDNPRFLQKLKLAQRAWIKFRDAHMESRYPTEPGQDQSFTYGSIYGECYCSEVAVLTNARVKELKAWLSGVEEGDGCSGSYKWDHQLR